MRIAKILPAAVLAAVLLTSVGCSSTKPGPVANPEKVCRDKFADAKKDFDKKNDPEAQTKLRDITVSCAGYDLVEDAQWMLAQSHDRTEQWLEAETEYGILVSNFERSKHVEEARWRMCRAAWQQAPSWDRDPSLTQKAAEKDRSYLVDYPAGKWADSARRDLDELVARLAERRYETARLYQKMDEPLAATIYYQLLLKEYPTSDKVGPARLGLARAYVDLEQFDRAAETIDSLALDSSRAASLGGQIAKERKRLESARKDFEARRAREAAEVKQGQL
jgi:outer membrane assembly lipoprotein YfiO